jgi:hypothetical protein
MNAVQLSLDDWGKERPPTTTWAVYRWPSVDLDTLTREAVADYYRKEKRLPVGLLCCPGELEDVKQVLRGLELNLLAQRLKSNGGTLKGELWLA